MNIQSRLSYLGRCQPDKTAVESAGDRLTYAELDLLVRRIAGFLRSQGAGPGDVVGLRLKDTPAHVAALFAVARIGAAILPLDWRGTAAELERVVGQFKPKVILGDGRLRDYRPPGLAEFAEAIDFEPDSGVASAGWNDVMAYNLTSGTTGLPKAVVTTHDQMLARCMTRAVEGIFTRDDRFLTVLPLAFTAGRETVICLLLLGATVVLFPSLFEPRELVEFVNKNKITSLTLSPNMSRAILREMAPQEGLLFPDADRIVSVTGRLEPEERAAMQSRIVKRVVNSYGSSGTGAMAVVTGDDDVAGPTAVGHCAIGMEIEIADIDGNALPTGQVGRIRVRGRAVANEIVGAPSGEERIRDGWYYPGDMGSLDKRGILHLADREADLIKRGGLMVHAQEVEQVLRRHPDITDAAVVGAPSPELGQIVVAFVVGSGGLTAKDIVRYCRGELAGYKIPARIEFLDALPMNAMGKVMKAKLLQPE